MMFYTIKFCRLICKHYLILIFVKAMIEFTEQSSTNKDKLLSQNPFLSQGVADAQFSEFISGTPKMVSTRTLMKIAAFGGFATVSFGVFVNWELQARLQKAEYFREAMKTLRGHPGAITLLGEPIKMGQLNLGDTTKNFCDGYKAQFEVPVKGPVSKGTLYFWAEREDPKKKWDVYKVHLDIDGVKDKRLCIKDSVNKNE